MDKRSVLLLKIPQNNNKNEAAADGFFTQIGEILKGKKVIITAEIAIFGKFLWFFLTCPTYIKDVVRGQWQSFYPDSEIEEIKDYTEKLLFNYQPKAFVGCELYLGEGELIPILTYKELEKNPLVALAGIASSFAQNESGFIQLVLEAPKKEDIFNKLGKKMRESGRNKTLSQNPTAKDYLELEDKKDDGVNFKTTIRFLATGASPEKTQLNLASMVTVYKKNLERSKMQKFKESNFYSGAKIVDIYKSRLLSQTFSLGKKFKFKFSPTEIATFFHLPYDKEEISQIAQIRSKKAPPPHNLPTKSSNDDKNITFFGETNFQNQKNIFGIKTEDRRRHLYAVGKSGTGKSKFLELLISSDLQADRGIIIMDPHGDLAKEVINMIPERRLKDVIYFDPSDIDYPIGFNPMEGVGAFEFRQNIVAGFISIFKKLFGLNWNERFEHVLRYTTLALLEYPAASILGLPRMLTDNMFRQDVISYITDPLVKKFWTTEFAGWNDQFASEAIVPIINKVGQFIANPMVRNIVGQAKTGFSLDDIMNKEKILVCNLSVGKLGEENSALLGSMLITKIWQSAISRTSIPEEERKDVFLYIDEFQNFATTAFSNILSEARKYRLNLTAAHQYIQQLPAEVRAAIFGNIGNIVSFRVGGEDAQILVKEYEPVFTVNDFLNLDIRNFFIKMSIDGTTAQPFSAMTITLNKPIENKLEKVIEASRKQWGRPRKEVEEEIQAWESGKITIKKEQKPVETPQEEFFPEPII
ncbi:MAG: hypothetical protein US40_C0003G0037 [Candidatus Roizmanbacteria bacterium GW2011_GWC2_37_13]|uniref:Helicase HerA central domain-containing protein n=1 Tax=Candidatus Roizmanbacteria bacterium GW2011_GWC2_37_13 TaxID=1618486 RepID=A0A0G0GJ93_9BACT|nr:MAG: hypothetical protein US38_C0004G0039 [Candidatus Roizmanbacteria bacterium GW2011_GWC1_37_12]KKQ26185.1 MAG: hypothetical protein US40_C0003G0037 [Candidatus Roizmanbacteria bacterium GW2011_GWC2_37_13]